MKTDHLERLKQIKCFLFDMDGTINLGMELIPGMEGFFDRLKEAGRSYYLVTNNSSKNHEHYVKKMNSMGVPVTKNNILISSDALVSHLKHSKPGARLFVLGTPELKATIKEGGFTLTSRLEDETDLVVVGFDQTLTYETLTIACRLIDRGVPYIATHPDVRCPIEGGEYIPDTGAFLACIKTATGKDPEYITGKPYGYMVDTVMERTGLKKEEIAMVGDRLMTDIRFGTDNGILSILVLTGEATLEDVEQGPVKPDIILPHAKEILKYL
ncbi:MAG: HAD-IIA family hydrolase [Acidaminococcaceae bacterium]|nr:HAD-IIA family hydrolase [Acidaminococcaceae bacterium]MBQ6777888.1 HAD-IIA family hydrolase [Acidaminococcaceae bacterium]